MSTFAASQIYEVVTRKHYGHLSLGANVSKLFWQDVNCHYYKIMRGCYIFGILHGSRFVPTYIGKATKTFGQEIFTSHKREHYNQALKSRKNGSAGIIFVYHEYTKRPNISSIDRLETQLIQQAVRRKLDLTNLRKKYIGELIINGVFDFKSGKRPPGRSHGAAKRLRLALKFSNT